MSYMLPHLHNGWQVDQAILSEEDRVIVIRFGHDWDPTCMKMDEVLYSIAEKVKNFAVIYLVDITEVPDFNKMYELYDPCTVMFFFRYKLKQHYVTFGALAVNKQNCTHPAEEHSNRSYFSKFMSMAIHAGTSTS
uniref:Thioredoxin-like 4A n=1 Tax=Sinocyclocheilus rhinocerous TaxID=307959 RepID=A0A673LTD4_9TELE